MSLANERTKISYTGNGATTVFAYNFKVFNKAHMRVLIGSTEQTVDVDYTVSGVGEAAGGNVIFGTAPVNEISVVIMRDMDAIQETEYTTSGSFPASAHEAALDRLTMLVQQQLEKGNRTGLLPVEYFEQYGLDPLVFPGPAPSTVVGWNAAGDQLTGYSATTAYAASPDALSNHSNNFATAVAAIGASVQTLKVDVVPDVLTAHVTIPDTLHLEWDAGFVLDLDDYNLICNGTIRAGFYQIFDESGTGVVTFPSGQIVQVGWWGTDAAGIGNAIDAANGCRLEWSAGTYSISTIISKTFTAAQQWVANGPVTIYWGGAVANNMVTIELAFFDFIMKGSFLFSGNNTARGGFRINNATTDMDTEAVNIHLEDVRAVDMYSVTAGQSSQGIQIIAGANLITLKRCGAKNISRDAGVGVPGSQGSSGISVSNAGINRYARQVSVIDPEIENVTSEEADGDADNVDCDGLSVLGPAANLNGNVKMDTVLNVRGGRFTNCRGRSIKSQMESNVINAPTFVRGGAGDRSVQGGVEVDFQRGSGTLKDFECYYSAITGLGAADGPFGDSFKIANATTHAHSPTEGAFIVKGGHVVNDVDAADYIPYGFIIVAGGNTFRSAAIEDITMLGVGRIGQFIRGDLATLKSLRVNGNYISNMITALIYTTNSAGNCKAEVTGNTLGTGAAVLAQAQTGVVPEISGYGNTGFPEDFTSNATNATEGEILRVRRIMPAGSTQGGGIVPDGVSVANGASQTFEQRNYSVGIGIYLITCSFSRLACGMFAANGNSIVDGWGGASTLIAYSSTGSSLDTADKLNVWFTGGEVHIKNLLDDAPNARVFSLISIG